MANYYDEYIKKNSPENWAMIEQAKQAYTTAQQNNDNAGMQQANNQANAIRSAYGYSSSDGTNFTPNQQTSTWGNAYQQVLGMRNQAKNAYSDLVNKNTNTNVTALNNNRRNINQNYNQSVNTLNQSKVQQQQQLPEQLAKMGFFIVTGKISVRECL